MKLKSLIQNSNRLEVAEVEIEFIPGIPQIHFLGLPDRIIKESFYRIKSALKSSGYKFPVTSQMIVNIKPHHLRKSSRGVELAVALGILLKTEQIEADRIHSDWVIYGELGLDGNIYEPSDLYQGLAYQNEIKILTGFSQAQPANNSAVFRLENLREMDIHYSEKKKSFRRPPEGLEKFYTEKEAEFLFLAAASGLHGLLAGDSGAGKSTLARSLVSFLPEPQEGEFIREENAWRPVVAPHQSLSPAAFLGGGANLYEGEIERALGGILLLDELLEFDPEIMEALRGPMTGEKLRLSRGPGHREILSQFQVMATTNLCLCGKWTPLKGHINCRFTRQKCTRTLERFSGPLLDRFGLLLFSTHEKKRGVKGTQILERILNLQENKVEVASVTPYLDSYYGHLSARRRNYLGQVATIFARDRKSDTAQICDYNQAEQWVIRPFEQLEKGMG